mmetsp:Transcript_15664/g.31514  ORF Transcript_15664/g.31514 Transcript_15664/m.31514 type:complete len:216 (-) Transcript_15664:618-1265(-)
MLNLASIDQPTVGLEKLDDVLVGVLDKTPLELGHLVGKAAVSVERADERVSFSDDAVSKARLVILLAERWCTMHDAGTSVRGDEIAGDHLEAARLAVGLKISEGRRVLLTSQLRAGEAGDLSKLLLRLLLFLWVAQIRVKLHESRGQQNVLRAALGLFDPDILEGRVDAEGEVGREGPWGGGPSDELGVGFIEEREGADHRWVIHLLVILLHLEV